MPIGYTYILRCSDDSYYTGSTINLKKRLAEHKNGEGAQYTASRLPVELIYVERYSRIDFAFNREHQLKKWSRKKKEALINGALEILPELAKNYTEYGKVIDPKDFLKLISP